MDPATGKPPVGLDGIPLTGMKLKMWEKKQARMAAAVNKVTATNALASGQSSSAAAAVPSTPVGGAEVPLGPDGKPLTGMKLKTWESCRHAFAIYVDALADAEGVVTATSLESLANNDGFAAHFAPSAVLEAVVLGVVDETQGERVGGETIHQSLPDFVMKGLGPVWKDFTVTLTNSDFSETKDDMFHERSIVVTQDCSVLLLDSYGNAAPSSKQTLSVTHTLTYGENGGGDKITRWEHSCDYAALQNSRTALAVHLGQRAPPTHSAESEDGQPPHAEKLQSFDKEHGLQEGHGLSNRRDSTASSGSSVQGSPAPFIMSTSSSPTEPPPEDVARLNEKLAELLKKDLERRNQLLKMKVLEQAREARMERLKAENSRKDELIAELESKMRQHVASVAESQCATCGVLAGRKIVADGMVETMKMRVLVAEDHAEKLEADLVKLEEASEAEWVEKKRLQKEHAAERRRMQQDAAELTKKVRMRVRRMRAPQM